MKRLRLNEPSVPPSMYLLRRRVEHLIDLPRLITVIDADMALIGAGVVYIDADYNVIRLRRVQPVCSTAPKQLVIQEMRKTVKPQQYASEIKYNPRQARVLTEVAEFAGQRVGAVQRLVFMMGSGVSVISSVFAMPLCLRVDDVSVPIAVRSREIKGGATRKRQVYQLDNAPWYAAVSEMLDAASGLQSNSLMINYLRQARSATGQSWLELVRTLEPQQRRALSNALLRLNHSSLTLKQLHLSQQIGRMKKCFLMPSLNKETYPQIVEALGKLSGVVGTDTLQSIVVSTIESWSA
ncbi:MULTISPECIES: hypothetical protein [Pseudomonas]|uniref:Uncharacterized protein n=1 Tax=Pseudomonas putida TaxID=303 RepID=A0A1B2F649_PSEPU|nr:MULTISPECIES: hypothetical protein [Pseudomonas]ANY87613.1 hypothetical protein IEC33019_2053 [Pseudomonas putida]MCL8308327.1 hypothetical protein [Pseudomonas putida]